MAGDKPTNEEIARILEQIADLLEEQEENTYRVRAYRNGAVSVRAAEEPVAELARRDPAGLQALPDIGQGLSGVIEELVETGRSSLLQRLQGEVSPQAVFSQVPGIGPELANRIVSQLKIGSLEELEQAAHDGRLDRVEGFGPKRLQTVRLSLAGMLSGAARRHLQEADTEKPKEQPARPPVVLLLDVDAEYRRRAEADELKKIAPRRFNPEGKAWLPIMNVNRDNWRFTALYSNTARAHELDAIYDWVVVYYERPGQKEQQATVVTAGSGSLQGKRVVRGREKETREYYDQ